jgi:hypothetical protein
VFDFVRRATREGDRDAVLGSWYAWHVSVCTLILLFASISFGMVMADVKAAIAHIQLPLIDGYSVMLVGGVGLSLMYAIRIDAGV